MKRHKATISVVVTTYNHEKFIAQCLDSILEQEDCPEFEIIIGNDCSTDKTGEIIKQYADKYDIIKVLPRTVNIGMQKNLKDCFAHCQGKYVAIVEGDDYLCDKRNLSKRYEVLKNNKRASMVFNDIYIYNESTKEQTPHAVWAKKDMGTVVHVPDIIFPFNVICNFSCCMYRKSTIENIPESYYQPRNADWLFNLYALDMSYGVFLKEYLSVYRIHTDSSYSSSGKKQQSLSIFESAWRYDKIFQHKYSKQFFEYATKRIKEGYSELERQNNLLEKQNKDSDRIINALKKNIEELNTNIRKLTKRATLRYQLKILLKRMFFSGYEKL